MNTAYTNAQSYYASLKRQFMQELGQDFTKLTEQEINQTLTSTINKVNTNYQQTKVDDKKFNEHFGKAVDGIVKAYLKSGEKPNVDVSAYVQKQDEGYREKSEQMKKRVRTNTKRWLANTYKTSLNNVFTNELFDEALNTLKVTKSAGQDYGVLKNLLLGQARIKLARQTLEEEKSELFKDLTSLSAQKGIQTSFYGLMQEHDIMQALSQFFGSERTIHSGEVKRLNVKGSKVDIGSDILIFANSVMDEEANKLKSALSAGEQVLPVNWELTRNDLDWQDSKSLSQLYGASVKKWSLTALANRKYVGYGLSLGYHNVGLPNVDNLKTPYFTNLKYTANKIVEILGIRNVIFANADGIWWMDDFISAFRRQGLYAQVATKNFRDGYWKPRGSYSAIELNVNKWRVFS